MNSIAAIAQAIAEGAPALAPGQEVHIPVDEHRLVRVLRRTTQSSLGISVATYSVGRSEQEQTLAREALLRLGADTRYTQAIAGGVDTEGRECVLADLPEPFEPDAIEALLTQMMARCAAPAGSIGEPASEAAMSPIDMAARWLRV